jgi:hypothetical protein
VTGIAALTVELDPKRLELLRELVPNAGLIGALLNPNRPDGGGAIAGHAIEAKALRKLKHPSRSTISQKLPRKWMRRGTDTLRAGAWAHVCLLDRVPHAETPNIIRNESHGLWRDPYRERLHARIPCKAGKNRESGGKRG